MTATENVTNSTPAHTCFCSHFAYVVLLKALEYVAIRWISLMAQLVKNLLANAGDAGDTGLIPEWGDPPGGENDNPLWYFLPAKYHEKRNLVSYNPKGHKESDTTEWTQVNH